MRVQPNEEFRSPHRSGLHIATITNGFGGSGLSGTEHSLALAQRGHRITMFTYSENSLPKIEHSNLTVQAVDTPFWGGLPYPDAVLSFASAIKRCAERLPIDVIHAHYAVTHGEAALLARDMIVADRTNAPKGQPKPAVVITCRGTDITRFAADARTSAAVKYVLDQADGLTFVSRSLQERASFHLGTIQNGVTIPNFLPRFDEAGEQDSRNVFAESPESVIFFHVSNFREIKNVCWIVKAFAAAVSSRPGGAPAISLLLVGDGPTRNAAEELVRKLGIGYHTTFTGMIPAEKVRPTIRKADVLLMASDSEGCPRAVLEAMGEAKPVIATNVDGLKELVSDGNTGYLCPPGDVESFAKAIVKLAVDSQLRQVLGESARREVTRAHDRDAVMLAYESVYASALERMKS